MLKVLPLKTVYSSILSKNSVFLFESNLFNVRSIFSLNKCNQLLTKQKSIVCISVSDRCMAGHAKWQNIKFIKAEKDREKHITCNKFVRLIRYAVKENGPDPKNNQKLKNLLEEARKLNVPKDTLENALKRGSDKKSKFGSIEILGPGGCMIVVEYETSNVSEIRHDIKFLCKKYSANVMSGEGRWRAVFEQKGIIIATKELNGEKLNEEKALDSAIEAGAEEVHLKEDGEGKSFLEFICAPDDLHKVKKELEQRYEIEENYVAYLPMNTVALSEGDLTLVDGFLQEIENLADVVRIFENVQ